MMVSLLCSGNLWHYAGYTLCMNACLKCTWPFELTNPGGLFFSFFQAYFISVSFNPALKLPFPLLSLNITTINILVPCKLGNYTLCFHA